MGFLNEYRQVTSLLKQKHAIVFYSESRHYFSYFEQLIHDILGSSDSDILYITSDKNDPVLKTGIARIKPVYCKWMLGFLFSRLQADVMLMTMPDLDNFLFKRSPGVGTCIYIFHAAVSTHQQYRKQAFDHYDVIFCTGDYQATELKKAEQLYQKKKKLLVPYGYPLFETIEGKRKRAGKREKATILVAPSWFDGCIFDSCLEELLQQLASLPYHVILRSHPEFEKRKPAAFKRIKQLLETYKNIMIDTEPDVISRLAATDVLITDRSGIAFEFAFGAAQPVIFIETALKQVNPDWKELEIDPIENSTRDEIGVRLSPADLQQLPSIIENVVSPTNEFRETITRLKKELFYNSPGTYQAGSEFVISRVKK